MGKDEGGGPCSSLARWWGGLLAPNVIIYTSPIDAAVAEPGEEKENNKSEARLKLAGVRRGRFRWREADGSRLN